MNLNFKTNQAAKMPHTGKPKLARGKKPLLGAKSDSLKNNEAILETSPALWQELYQIEKVRRTFRLKGVSKNTVFDRYGAIRVFCGLHSI